MNALASILFVTMLLASATDAYRVKVDFHDGRVQDFDVPGGNLTADELLAGTRRAVVFGEDSQYDKRQQCVTRTRSWYELIGDGKPHQNYEITQIEGTIVGCPGAIEQGISHTTSWGFSIGAEAAYDVFDFGNVGFSVSEEVTTSTSYTFECNERPSEICALDYTAVTALSVNFYEETTCGSYTTPAVHKGKGTVYLPNADGVGSIIQRGANFGGRNIIQCRGDVERKVSFHCGPKGGPEWFYTKALGPWTKDWLEELDPSTCVYPIEAFHFEDSD